MDIPSHTTPTWALLSLHCCTLCPRGPNLTLCFSCCAALPPGAETGRGSPKTLEWWGRDRWVGAWGLQLNSLVPRPLVGQLWSKVYAILIEKEMDRKDLANESLGKTWGKILRWLNGEKNSTFYICFTRRNGYKILHRWYLSPAKTEHISSNKHRVGWHLNTSCWRGWGERGFFYICGSCAQRCKYSGRKWPEW